MICLIPLTLNNYKDIAKPGKRVVTPIGYGVIQSDPSYTDGIKLLGSSVKSFLESHNEVYIMSTI